MGQQQHRTVAKSFFSLELNFELAHSNHVTDVMSRGTDGHSWVQLCKQSLCTAYGITDGARQFIGIFYQVLLVSSFFIHILKEELIGKQFK